MPIDTYRGARLMSRLVERLEGEVRGLRAELAELTALHDAVVAERRRRSGARDRLSARRAELEELIAARRDLRRSLAASRAREQRDVVRLAREAESLVDLVDKLGRAETRRRRDVARRAAGERQAVLHRRAMIERGAARDRARRRAGSDLRLERRQAAREAERRARARVVQGHAGRRVLRAREAAAKRRAALETARLADEATRLEAASREEMLQASALPPSLVRFSESRGKLPLPARGRIVGRFGAIGGAAGQPSKGIRLQTAPETPVVAPFDGRVVFAGEFRDYGLLLIISLGEEYHLLLSGMSRVYGIVGQHVLAGGPLGEMGPIDGAAPTLYVELRRGGKPINPLPWMAAAKGKVSG